MTFLLLQIGNFLHSSWESMNSKELCEEQEERRREREK